MVWLSFEPVLAVEVILMLIGLVVMIFFLFSGLSIFFGAPFVKTSREAVKAALKMAKLKKGERFYDLGSGDGNVISIAAEFGAKATGVEINPVLWLWSKCVARLRGSKAKFILGSFFSVDLRDADVVFIYALPGTNERLKGKLEHELKKGARVISHGFEFAGWRLRAKDEEHCLLLYLR